LAAGQVCGTFSWVHTRIGLGCQVNRKDQFGRRPNF